MNHISFARSASALCMASLAGQEPSTTITKWQDGKAAAVSITFDDSTINQFRIAVPMMKQRRLPGIAYQSLPAANLRSYFDYMKANEDRLWVTPFRDAAKYARERMGSKVTVTQSGGAASRPLCSTGSRRTPSPRAFGVANSNMTSPGVA